MPKIVLIGLRQMGRCVECWTAVQWLCRNYREARETAPLYRFLGDRAHETDWGFIMAATTLTLLPIVIVFFLAQRTFIEGITLTGVKG